MQHEDMLAQKMLMSGYQHHVRCAACVQGAKFDVTVFIGDPQVQTIKWPIGSLTVLQRDGVHKVPPSKPSKCELLYKAQPVITHMHRSIPRQPPMIVPLTATALVAVVLLAWLVLLFKSPLNLDALPSGADFGVAVAFHVLLAAALSFAVWYWLRLTLIDALVPLAVLASAMVLVGHRALSTLADRRIAREGKVSKED
jgi:hypothetical protein